MKKFVVLFLSAVLLFTAAACGGPGGTAGGADSSGGGQNSVETVLASEIGGEITVSCYDSMTYKSFLEEAAILFEEKYPGTKVNIETFSAMPEIRTSETGNMRMATIELQDDPQSRADYINRVSTTLMSGTGADVFAADVLPVYKFAENGQLENLAVYMDADADFDKSAYRANIFDALMYKGGLWVMPLDYSFDYIAYDSTLISTDDANFGVGSAFNAEQLIEAAAPIFDGSTRLFNMYDYIKAQQIAGGGLFAQLMNESYSRFVDIINKEAHFIDGGFIDMLSSLKDYVQKGYINEGLSAQSVTENFRGSVGQAPTERFYYKYKNNAMLLQQFNQDTNRRMMMYVGGNAMGIEEDDMVAGIAADADGNVPFTYRQGYALNSASLNKQTAWAFIKFLLSEEMQLSPNLMPLSLPLHNAARAQRAELTLTSAFGGVSIPGGATQPGSNQPEPNQAAPQQDGSQQQGPQLPDPNQPDPNQPEPQQPDPRQSGSVQENLVIPLDDDLKEVLRQYNEALEALSDQINTYIIEDSVINDMIAAETPYYFDGVKNAEEVAQVLQNKVTLYLNE